MRAALAALEDRKAGAEEERAAQDRLRWALEYADRVDPLGPGEEAWGLPNANKWQRHLPRTLRANATAKR